jgi:site-specific DNA recombinase
MQVRYLAYVRKSSENSERQALSIDGQSDAVKVRFASLNIVDVVAESKSAFKPYNRTLFDDVLLRIERGEVEGLVAWHPNRLSRNEIDAGRIIYLLRRGLLKDLQFVTYTFENTPEGIWMLQMQLSQSQYESAKLGREVSRGMNQKIEQGYFPDKAPPGYLNSGPGSEKGRRVIYNDDDRLLLVRKMMEYALTGNHNTAELHRMMLDWGFTTWSLVHRKERAVTYAQVRKMLANVFYTGYFKWNGVLHRGNHKAILTWPEYDRLQQIMRRQVKNQDRRYVRRDYIAFSGLLRCGECGFGVTATEKRKYYRGTNRTAVYLYYHCTHKSKSVCCRQPAVSERLLVAELASEVAKLHILAEFRDWALDILDRRRRTTLKEREVISENRARRLADAKARLRRLIDMRAAEEIGVDDFKVQQEGYKKKIWELEAVISKGNDTASVAPAAVKKVFTELAAIKRVFDDASPQEKRRVVINLSGSNPVLTNRKVVLQAKKWLVPIQDGYSALETEYLMVRTRDFGSAKEKTTNLAYIIAKWCRVVNAVADLVEGEIDHGGTISAIGRD